MISKIKDFLYRNRLEIVAGLGILTGGYLLYQYVSDQSEVKLSTFIEAVKLEQVDEVVVQGRTIFFRNQNSDWYSTFLGRFPINDVFNILRDKKIAYSTCEPIISKDTLTICAAALFSAIAMKYMISQIQKPPISSAAKSSVYKNNHSFDDFYGGENIKLKFRQIIDFLKNPQKYQKMGARIRRGVLFFGPPGTGKTMLARALANQAGCEFIKIVASEFQQMYVGVGPKRVRELFQNARKCPNGCIIFVDQIDAMGSRMNSFRDSHQTTSTINQLLSEMDGFSPMDRIVIVAATNRIDLVDQAILRAGRFDIKVQIPLPNREERKGIFMKLLQKKAKHNEISQDIIDIICDRSEQWCGADLQTLINESIYKAIRDKSERVMTSHLKAAFQDFQCHR